MDVYKADPSGQEAGSLSELEAAKFIGCCSRHLLDLRQAGKAPPYYRIGNRLRYPRHLLERWMEQAVAEAVPTWPRRKPAKPEGGAE